MLLCNVEFISVEISDANSTTYLSGDTDSERNILEEKAVEATKQKAEMLLPVI
jgi:hypothetical protein